MKLADAFASAVRGRQKSLALEHFGARGESEMSSILAGHRRPTFALIEDAFDEQPDALFAYVSQRFGVKVEKPTVPLAAQLELFGAELISLAERVSEALERAKAQERGASMARVSPQHQQRSRGRA